MLAAACLGEVENGEEAVSPLRRRGEWLIGNAGGWYSATWQLRKVLGVGGADLVRLGTSSIGRAEMETGSSHARRGWGQLPALRTGAALAAPSLSVASLKAPPAASLTSASSASLASAVVVEAIVEGLASLP